MARANTGDNTGGTASRAAGARRRGNVRDLPDGPPDETGLTPRQRKVLEVIRDAVDRRGYPPSVREIGESVGLTSTSSVAHQLKVLGTKGFLRRDPNRAVDAESAPASLARHLADDAGILRIIPCQPGKLLRRSGGIALL